MSIPLWEIRILVDPLESLATETASELTGKASLLAITGSFLDAVTASSQSLLARTVHSTAPLRSSLSDTPQHIPSLVRASCSFSESRVTDLARFKPSLKFPTGTTLLRRSRYSRFSTSRL
jgi:hypothetical protein